MRKSLSFGEPESRAVNFCTWTILRRPVFWCSSVTIRELAELVCDVIGFDGELVWDKTKPDGTPRKLLDVTRIRALGWEPTIPLREGISQTYEWFLGQ